jgi:hypothetical protein
MSQITARRAVNRLVCTAIDLGVANADKLDPDGVFGPVLTEALRTVESLEYATGNIFTHMMDEIELTSSLHEYFCLRLKRDHLGRKKWTPEVDAWLNMLKVEAAREIRLLAQNAEKAERILRGGVEPKREKNK